MSDETSDGQNRLAVVIAGRESVRQNVSVSIDVDDAPDRPHEVEVARVKYEIDSSSSPETFTLEPKDMARFVDGDTGIAIKSIQMYAEVPNGSLDFLQAEYWENGIGTDVSGHGGSDLGPIGDEPWLTHYFAAPEEEGGLDGTENQARRVATVEDYGFPLDSDRALFVLDVDDELGVHLGYGWSTVGELFLTWVISYEYVPGDSDAPTFQGT